MHDTPPYSLDQLADASGEQARTIRSWIKEGVLPAALGKGRGAFYGQEHMDRLLFVRRLREETGTRLPLAMIRDILQRLYASNDPDVVRRVAHGEESLKVAGLTEPSGVVEESSMAYGDVSRMAMHSVEHDDEERDDEDFLPLLSASRPAPSPPAAGEVYTTIQIQKDLELRLRSDDPHRVAWLARLARKLRTWIHEGEP